jgi:hypothetical protein
MLGVAVGVVAGVLDVGVLDATWLVIAVGSVMGF